MTVEHVTQAAMCRRNAIKRIFLSRAESRTDNHFRLMLLRVSAIGFISLAMLSSAFAQLTGTVETYFQSDSQKRGVQNLFSWAEVEYRANANLKGTVSYIAASGFNALDEACLSLESGLHILRLGRMHTAFGFSDWSEEYYNGFNHLPLVRTAPLIDGLGLTRDDSGAEITFGGPHVQVQAAVVDTNLDTYQFAPKHFDASTARLQVAMGSIIVGLDSLWRFNEGEGIAGLDIRWTIPHLIVRGEFMGGIADEDRASGFYVDATYRLPRFERTQLVGRYERLYCTDQGDFVLQTLGLRQVVGPNLTLNVNYGWGSGAAAGLYGSPITEPALQGWSARAMFQIHF